MPPPEETPIKGRIWSCKSKLFLCLPTLTQAVCSVQLWPRNAMETLELHHVLCTAWDFPCVSLTVTQWHSGGRRGRVCCGNHNVEKAVLHLYFDVVLFCRHVGLLLPLVHSPSWILTKQQKESPQPSLSPSFFIYSLKASFFASQEVTLSCLLDSQ